MDDFYYVSSYNSEWVYMLGINRFALLPPFHLSTALKGYAVDRVRIILYSRGATSFVVSKNVEGDRECGRKANELIRGEIY